jgi:hypothetical protein
VVAERERVGPGREQTLREPRGEAPAVGGVLAVDDAEVDCELVAEARQPLPDRAAALAAWLEQHREPTATNLNYWLYEHAYIVAGAKFGWWHGAEALQTLIAVDQRAEELWGVGKQSEQAARSALAEVAARTR